MRGFGRFRLGSLDIDARRSEVQECRQFELADVSGSEDGAIENRDGGRGRDVFNADPVAAKLFDPQLITLDPGVVDNSPRDAFARGSATELDGAAAVLKVAFTSAAKQELKHRPISSDQAILVASLFR